MKLKFYANACCSYESQGKVLLCDPWLTDGAFEGSWFHYPPLKTRPQDVANADYLYISHLHPDHYDPQTLKHFRRDIPLVVLDHGANYLTKLLTDDGFTNLIPIKDKESKDVGPFKLTMYAPFVGNAFAETSIGNPIDSALVVEADRACILNTNDNTPDVPAAKMLKERHPNITIAQLNYNAAGPYPSCFTSLTFAQRINEHDSILKRNFDLLIKTIEILEPYAVMPFAGSFVLGGKNWEKNTVLGTTTEDEVAAVINSFTIAEALLLNEGQTFDLSRSQSDGVYRPINELQRWSYIESVLAHKVYPYESDAKERVPAETLEAAVKRLRETMNRLNVHPDCKLIIYLDPGAQEVDLSKSGDSPNQLVAEIDHRLLNRILKRQAHWNNAEIGCHIDFYRDPNIYQYDVHMLLSHFHV